MRSQSINQDLTKHSDDLIRPFGRIIRTEWSFKAAASPPTDGVNLAACSIREYPDHASEAETKRAESGKRDEDSPSRVVK